ncbi:MAG: hypothetical protein RR898_07025 [Clostridium sp.]|uniref:hypothetical protein n=1 Tax=Clostridium sp. TaxID=1506 RepID=UPI002FCB1427
MTRLSSIFFLIALLAYYLPVVFKCKRSIYGKIHVYSGIASLITMVIAVLMAIGTDSFLKNLGFAIILAIIVITGFLLKDKKGIYRKLHIISTIGFFIYLAGIIIL